MGNNTKHISTLGVKNIPNRDAVFKNADTWMDDKRAIDGAEGIWRVHNDLFDFTKFVEKHPGGKFWLDVTKGTDITEAFESHHISTLPESMLKNYFIRKAKSPRNSPFTFKENGFYRTLKRNTREVLKTIPKNSNKSSNIIADSLLTGAFVFAILASAFWSYTFALISGVLLASMGIASHNYYHQRDNFRMYYSDISLINSREWRIIHILSHHLYTNTVADMQAYISEPLINMYPESKSPWIKYGSWIYTPLVFWPIVVYVLYFVRIYQGLVLGYTKSVTKSDLLGLTLPLTMYTFGGQTLLETIGMWFIILSIHSFWYALVANGTTHFHPEIFVDGDASRPENERDWGIHELDTVADKHEVTGSHFLVMVTFGDHALHHLFPTFDHGVLHHLYPVVEKTMKEFNLDIRMSTYTDLIGGFFRQMARDKPNPNPPNLLKAKSLKYH